MPENELLRTIQNDLFDVGADLCFPKRRKKPARPELRVQPEQAARLTINATAALRVLVIYIPPGEDHFCAEPVSNITDAFNLARSRGDTGLLRVAPGRSVSARVAFRPEPRVEP